MMKVLVEFSQDLKKSVICRAYNLISTRFDRRVLQVQSTIPIGTKIKANFYCGMGERSSSNKTAIAA
jgi:hypothetical protein